MLVQNVSPIWVLLLIFFVFACDKPEDLGGCSFPADLENDYELVWSDEFEGDEIDLSKWGFDLADGCQVSRQACSSFPDTPALCGWGNNELQYYTDREENARVEDGKLIITAKREVPQFEGYQYTSARLLTKGKATFRYGRIDVRARMPIGQGLWPAIWMLSEDDVYGDWPCSGEIDIMEYLGHEPQTVLGTIHYGQDAWRFDTEEYHLESGNFHDDFHTFTLLWNEDCITFLVDAIPYSGPHSRSSVLPTTWPFDQDFHLILNVAVGGNLPGNPGPNTQFPQTMEVDYVRVYQPK